MFIFALLTGNIEGTIIEVINKIGSVFYGPILGAFILAIMTKNTHALGANIGILLGVTFIYIYGSLYLQFFGFGGMQLDALLLYFLE